MSPINALRGRRGASSGRFKSSVGSAARQRVTRVRLPEPLGSGLVEAIQSFRPSTKQAMTVRSLRAPASVTTRKTS